MLGTLGRTEHMRRTHVIITWYAAHGALGVFMCHLHRVLAVGGELCGSLFGREQHMDLQMGVGGLLLQLVAAALCMA